jgi:hypothetical protein
MDRFRGGRLGLVVAATVLMWAVPRAAAPRSYQPRDHGERGSAMPIARGGRASRNKRSHAPRRPERRRLAAARLLELRQVAVG